MSGLLLIIGLILLAVISFDVLFTTLTLRGGGFLTAECGQRRHRRFTAV